MARQHSPSIIFMDEIDSIGSTRLESGGGGDSEVQRTMLELLNQLDGFEPHQNIKVSSSQRILGSKTDKPFLFSHVKFHSNNSYILILWAQNVKNYTVPTVIVSRLGVQWVLKLS